MLCGGIRNTTPPTVISIEVVVLSFLWQEVLRESIFEYIFSIFAVNTTNKTPVVAGWSTNILSTDSISNPNKTKSIYVVRSINSN